MTVSSYLSFIAVMAPLTEQATNQQSETLAFFVYDFYLQVRSTIRSTVR